MTRASVRKERSPRKNDNHGGAVHLDLQVRWKNYRAFEDTEWIKIRPLTVIIGPNNSGKTSIVSPLVLMSQTMSSGDAVAPLVTQGPLVNAGMYRDIVHNHDLKSEICFGIRYHGHLAKGKVAAPGTYPPGAVEVSFKSGDRDEDMILRRFALFDWYMQPLFELIRGAKGNYSLKSKVLTGFKEREKAAIGKNIPVNFIFSIARVLNGMGGPENKGIRNKYSDSFMMYLTSLGMVGEELRDIFTRLSLIGPLRERLKRAYEVEGEMPVSVGLRGEHMAEIVRRRMGEIQMRLNDWVRRFEFGDELVLTSISDVYFALSFQGGPAAAGVNIADAGFGASQLLPLIVQALTARRGGLTICEQPEIHLNPRLQYVLGDLFVEMAQSGSRVIVETHSEHLLLRLRHLVARGKIDPGKVALYFVEMKGGIASIREIPIGSNGHISPDAWPHGFFEDSLRESFALAEAQVAAGRRSKRSRGGAREGKC